MKRHTIKAALVVILGLAMLAPLGCSGSLKAILTPWGAQEEAAEQGSAQIRRAMDLKRQLICIENAGCLTDAEKESLRAVYKPLIKAADKAKKELQTALTTWGTGSARDAKPTAVIAAEAKYSAQLDSLAAVLKPYVRGDDAPCKTCAGGE